jgi:spermidine synthase
MSSVTPEHPRVEPAASQPRWLHRVLYGCFFLSGTAGLIYQISWMKALGLVFGRTTYAITAVLCAFMAGLALGSWLLGRYGEKVRHPLHLYGWLELGIALTGLASLGGLWLTRWAYTHVYESLAASPALLLGFRFLASFLILLLPTTLMGGTYPVVVKYLTRRREELGAFASRLYWLNTAGAITGGCLAGFVLLWHLGLVHTVLVAAELNLAAAGLVLLSSLRLRARGIAAPEQSVEVQEKAGPTGPLMVLLVAGVSGFSAMMFEIGWTRILAIFLSSTTYAFTLMLATFLFGITLGSYLFERYHQRWQLSLKLLGYLLTLLALGGVLFLAISTKLAELTLWLTRASGESVAAMLGGQFLISFLAMIVPTTLFGLIFPLTVVLYCGGDLRRGARTGKLYAVNTLGAILGAFITGLFLIQWLNTVNTVLLASGLNGAVATALFVRANPKQRWRHAAVGLGLLVAVVGAAATEVFDHPALRVRTVVATAARGDFGPRLTLDELVRREKLVFLQEGINSTVSVARKQGAVYLRTDGKSEASTNDQNNQVMLACLPLSLHSQPRRVLVVGFGSGSTVYQAAQFSQVERVDVVEIEPAVLAAAVHLEELNHGVYEHPKVRVILDDARNYLMVSRERYDVIISEPSYLWSAGISNLYTREFYRQVREHLTPQGLFVQWVQAYQMAPRDLSTVLRTLGTTFNQMSLWSGGGTDLLILASAAVQRLSLGSLQREYARNGELRADLSKYLAVDEPGGLLGYFLLNDATLRQLAGHGELNTDDRTVLEYRAPLNMAKETSEVNHLQIRRVRKEVLPAFVALEDKKGAVLAGAETQIRARMLDQPVGASLVPVALRNAPESERTLLLRASVALAKKRGLTALSYLQRAEKLAPRSGEVAFRLGKLYLDQRQYQPARRALEKGLELSPQHPEALKALVWLEARTGRVERALELQQRLIAAEPPQLYEDWARLGKLYLAAGRNEKGLEAFKRSLELEPLGYLAHRNLADYFVRSGETQKAIEEHRFLIRYYPARDPSLYLRLSGLYRRTGNEGEAQKTLRKAKRLFPSNPRVQWGF